MKLVSGLFLIAALTSAALAQQELVRVEVRGDTVTIFDDNAFVNCSALFMIDVKMDKSTITMTERDTVRDKARCICHFDLQASLFDLAPGHYDVIVQREELVRYNYPVDTIILVGTASIDIAGGHGMTAVFGFVQSPCHSITSIVRPEAVDETVEMFTAYPVPSVSAPFIEIVLRRSATVKVQVFDELGRLRCTPADRYFTEGVHILNADPQMPTAPGVYFCVLTTGNNARMIPIVIR
jgi:hypothetical protein